MAKALFFVLAAALVVAALAFEFEDEEEMETDLEFLKRDPGMQDYLMAEKRGKSLKKYKYCPGPSGQACWCGRRNQKIVFCNGVANGDAM